MVECFLLFITEESNILFQQTNLGQDALEFKLTKPSKTFN